MPGHFYIGFIDFCWKVNFARVYQFIFSKKIWKKWQNNTKIFSLDSQKVKVKKIYCIVFGKHKRFKNLKNHTFLKKR